MHLVGDLISSKGKQTFINELKKTNSSELADETVLCREVKDIIAGFSVQKKVYAIALGGSMARGTADAASDYDIYIYLKGKLDTKIRESILSPFCIYMEIGNAYWEQEDNCILRNGIHIDIIYRNNHAFLQEIAAVVEHGASYNGYTTSLWHNATSGKILYEKKQYLTNLKKRFCIPYPKSLKNSIIQRNMNLLSNSITSYDKQIKKAVNRQDMVNINNRIAAFLDSYFDIIYAINEVKNPGEKNITERIVRKCKIIPKHFKENIDSLFYFMGNDVNKINDIIEKIIVELKCVVNTP